MPIHGFALALGFASLGVAKLAHRALAKQPGRSLRLAAFRNARDDAIHGFVLALGFASLAVAKLAHRALA